MERLEIVRRFIESRDERYQAKLDNARKSAPNYEKRKKARVEYKTARKLKRFDCVKCGYKAHKKASSPANKPRPIDTFRCLGCWRGRRYFCIDCSVGLYGMCFCGDCASGLFAFRTIGFKIAVLISIAILLVTIFVVLRYFYG